MALRTANILSYKKLNSIIELILILQRISIFGTKSQNMKKIILLLLFMPTILMAQKKEDVYKKVATSTCECATKSNEISDTALGICILDALNQLTDKEKKTIGYNGSNKLEVIEKISENIGIEMVSICPEVFTKLDKDTDEDQVDTEEIADEEDLVVNGTFESVVTNEFNTVSIIDEKNEKQEFLWLVPFEGDTLLIKKKLEKGDKLEITYSEHEFFDPKTNSYKKGNMILGMRLL